MKLNKILEALEALGVLDDIKKAGGGTSSVVGGAVRTFLGLTDTPSSYTGQGGRFLSVKGDETGVEFSTPSGAGDVTGPAGAVNNNIAVYDGTTGKIIKDGGSTIAEIINMIPTSHQVLTDLNWSAANHFMDIDLDMLGYGIDNLKQLVFDTSPATPGSSEGTVYWNGTEYTLNVVTGLGPVLQVGQEIYTIVYNDTVSQINNGTAVYPVGAVSGFPSIEEADATTHVTIAGNILVTTMDIPAGQSGLAATLVGKIRGVDTSGFTAGDTLWVSAGAGILNNITNVKPEFPNYAVQIGGASVINASTGVIELAIKGEPVDTVQNFWNGVFRESFDFRVSSNGTTVIGSLEPTNGHDDMTMIFSDGFALLNTSPAATITLTPGTDANPQNNYVYIPESTKVLTVSTSDWPSSVEHIKVARVVLQSAATTELVGALRNQNVNDEIQNTTTNQGHLSHIGEKLRQFEAQWSSGTQGTAVVAGGGVDVYPKVTAGVVYQMHRQSFPVLDTMPYTIDAVSQGSKTFTISDDGDLTSVFPDGRLIRVYGSTGNDGIYTVVSTSWSSPNFVITVSETIPDATADGTIGDKMNVPNDFTTAYDQINSLTDIATDASGVSLTNTSFSLVMWGVANKSGEESHLMINVPSSTYNKNFPDTAVSDAQNYSVYTIPSAFQGVGFLIARFTFVDNAGTWTLYDTEDLRGRIPNSTAGGGAGGAGVTDFTGLSDTPNSYSGEANNIPQVNTGETALEFTGSPTISNANITEATDKNYVTDAEKTVIGNTSGTNTGDEPAASTTVAGVQENATAGEVTTGTATLRTVTPDALAGSDFGKRALEVTGFDYTTDVDVGDGAGYITVPDGVGGMNLISVHARVITAGTTGSTDIQIHNVTQAVDMLTTKVTISSGDTSASDGVIDTDNDDVADWDLLRVDVDAVSTTKPKGLIVTLIFQLP